jgi:hypothetical protein
MPGLDSRRVGSPPPGNRRSARRSSRVLAAAPPARARRTVSPVNRALVGISGTPVRDAVHDFPCLLICWRECNDQESGPGERDGRRRAGRLRVPAGPGRTRGLRPPDCSVCHRALSDFPGEKALAGTTSPRSASGKPSGRSPAPPGQKAVPAAAAMPCGSATTTWRLPASTRTATAARPSPPSTRSSRRAGKTGRSRPNPGGRRGDGRAVQRDMRGSADKPRVADLLIPASQRPLVPNSGHYLSACRCPVMHTHAS